VAAAQTIVRTLPLGTRLAPQQAQTLRRSDLKIHAIYLAILGHLPWWARALIVIRNRIVSVFGIHAEPTANVWKPPVKDHYAPGDKILRFNLYSLEDNEIVTGRDDKHLDFRVSGVRVTEDGARKVVVSTLIFAHNLFGKTYLLFVLPPHRFGMQRLLTQAVTKGRI
jgi:Protein of unknown function (DUF2867)